MIFHGTVFFIIGLLAGIPYGQAISRKEAQRKIDAWRAAHTGLCMTGILTIAFGIALRVWADLSWLAEITTVAMVVSGYSFSFAMTLAAWSGSRGLSAAGPISNRLVFGGYAVAILGSFAGAFGFLRLACLHY